MFSKYIQNIYKILFTLSQLRKIFRELYLNETLVYTLHLWKKSRDIICISIEWFINFARQ